MLNFISRYAGCRRYKVGSKWSGNHIQFRRRPPVCLHLCLCEWIRMVMGTAGMAGAQQDVSTWDPTCWAGQSINVSVNMLFTFLIAHVNIPHSSGFPYHAMPHEVGWFAWPRSPFCSSRRRSMSPRSPFCSSWRWSMSPLKKSGKGIGWRCYTGHCLINQALIFLGRKLYINFQICCNLFFSNCFLSAVSQVLSVWNGAVSIRQQNLAYEIKCCRISTFERCTKLILVGSCPKEKWLQLTGLHCAWFGLCCRLIRWPGTLLAPAEKQARLGKRDGMKSSPLIDLWLIEMVNLQFELQ